MEWCYFYYLERAEPANHTRAGDETGLVGGCERAHCGNFSSGQRGLGLCGRSEAKQAEEAMRRVMNHGHFGPARTSASSNLS